MSVVKSYVKHAIACCGGLSFVLATASAALAADAVNLGTVQTTGQGEDQASQGPESAPYQAPTKTPLSATQPTSVISQQFIENNTPPSSNYDDVINISPSVYAVSPNGPGLAENQILSIRGFQDGQFNVTFDGIPWGDSNDFTHHTTSYFMDRDLGDISVDRGPGTAATIGNANFGGTVSINSKAPDGTTTITPYASYGSFNTQVFGAQFDTGPIAKYGGASGFIDGESLSSDGYLSNMGQKRKNLFAKGEVPIGTNTVVTAVAMYNQIQQYIGLGATQAQIDAHGPSYMLNTDPSSQAYYGYNYDRIHTDFEYIGVKSVLDGGWTIDNKTYTYAYFHDGYNGLDPNGETPNGTSYGPNNVPGQDLVNNYRSYGDTLRVTKDLPFGAVEAGVWGDVQLNTRHLQEADFTLGNAINPQGQTGTAIPGVDRALTQTLTSAQPYIQIDWKALPGFTVTPGVRYNYFSRSVNSQVNVKSGLPQDYKNTFDAVLPSLQLHESVNDHWVVYAQAAKGFLAPNENFFNPSDPNSTSIQPQETWSYQLGTSWQTQRLSASVDVYDINFNNLIGSHTVGGIVTFFNEGGATYKGVEAEATGYLGAGFSLYVNGSVNQGEDKQSNTRLANTPIGTAAAGAIYALNGWYGSLLDKWVGSRYGDVGATQPLSAYSTLDGALGYTFEQGLFGSSKPSLKLAFNNLLNSTKIYALAGYTGGLGTPLYWTIPGRSIFATVTLPF